MVDCIMRSQEYAGIVAPRHPTIVWLPSRLKCLRRFCVTRGLGKGRRMKKKRIFLAAGEEKMEKKRNSPFGEMKKKKNDVILGA